jgi:hypothetical protein
MDVEEDDAVPFAERGTVDPLERAADAIEHAGGDVSGDDRIGDAVETAVPQVHVRSAHF